MSQRLRRCRPRGWGVADINAEGNVTRQWVPSAKGVLKGDEGLLEVGLNWSARAPCQIFQTHASLGIGGFREIAGYPSDLAFACTLAYASGVRFYQNVIGRWRTGDHQTSHLLPRRAGRTHPFVEGRSPSG